MTKIFELSTNPQWLKTIVEWNLIEWPQPPRTRADVQARIYGIGTRDTLPLTLVLVEGNQPIGYTTLVLYEKGRASERPYWIDAVYVQPEKRKHGLGSKLIEAAEAKSGALGLTQLFALTDIPELYRKLGWSTVEVSAGQSSGFIVSKKIASSRG